MTKQTIRKNHQFLVFKKFSFLPLLICYFGMGVPGISLKIANADNACSTEIRIYDITPRGRISPHVPICSPVRYRTNPPTSGRHYPDWAQYKTYSIPVPHGFTVHNLEHGAIVISYNCPEGCEAELAQLAAFLDAAPTDPSCEPPVARKVVVTPDPNLDVRFAAAAWGAALKSNCFDLQALAEFVQNFYDQGPEETCLDGIDLEIPGLMPPDCGKPGSSIVRGNP